MDKKYDVQAIINSLKQAEEMDPDICDIIDSIKRRKDMQNI